MVLIETEGLDNSPVSDVVLEFEGCIESDAPLTERDHEYDFCVLADSLVVSEFDVCSVLESVCEGDVVRVCVSL